MTSCFKIEIRCLQRTAQRAHTTTLTSNSGMSAPADIAAGHGEMGRVVNDWAGWIERGLSGLGAGRRSDRAARHAAAMAVACPSIKTSMRSAICWAG